jgi:hypothetical protein
VLEASVTGGPDGAALALRRGQAAAVTGADELRLRGHGRAFLAGPG